MTYDKGNVLARPWGSYMAPLRWGRARGRAEAYGPGGPTESPASRWWKALPVRASFIGSNFLLICLTIPNANTA